MNEDGTFTKSEVDTLIKFHRQYNQPKIISLGAYARIRRAIYEKAKEWSLQHPRELITCPYKRSDFRFAWNEGLDDADELMSERDLD